MDRIIDWNKYFMHFSEFDVLFLLFFLWHLKNHPLVNPLTSTKLVFRELNNILDVYGNYPFSYPEPVFFRPELHQTSPCKWIFLAANIRLLILNRVLKLRMGCTPFYHIGYQQLLNINITILITFEKKALWWIDGFCTYCSALHTKYGSFVFWHLNGIELYKILQQK